MKARWEEAVLKFANKLVESNRFRDLFPLNNAERTNTRNRKKYLEETSRTSRLYDSPLFFLRRLLNEQNEEDIEDADFVDLFNEKL